MPFLAAPAGMAIASLIGTGAAVGAQVYGANRASGAARDAAQASDRAAREALAFEREKEKRRQEEWDRMMREEEARWNAEQERLAPYRAASEGALSQLVSLAGLPAYTPKAVEKPDFNKPMPEDWQPGDPTGLEKNIEQALSLIRKPTSSSLVDLLREPGTREQVMQIAESVGGGLGLAGEPRPPIEAEAPETRVSEAAYQRLAPQDAEVRSLVRSGGFGPRRI